MINNFKKILEYNIFVGIVISMCTVIFCFLKPDGWSVGLLFYTIMPLAFFFLMGLIGSFILKNTCEFLAFIRKRLSIILSLLFILILMEVGLYYRISGYN